MTMVCVLLFARARRDITWYVARSERDRLALALWLVSAAAITTISPAPALGAAGRASRRAGRASNGCRRRPRRSRRRRRRFKAPAPKPPLPNRFNEVTPKWLTLRGEYRDRMEGGTNIGYTSGRDDVYNLSRFRFDVAVKPSPLLSVLVQAQDARVQRKGRRLDDGAVPEPVRSAPGVCRHRRHAEGIAHAAGGPAGDVLRRAAPGRAPHLGQHRAKLRRRARDVPREATDSGSTRSRRRSCEFSTASSTRAATATAFSARTARRRHGFRKPPSSLMCSGGATRNSGPSAATSAISRPPPSARGGSASCRRRFDYGVEMAVPDGLARIGHGRRVGGPLDRRQDARRRRGTCGSPRNTTSPPATAIRPTAGGRRSTSCIRPATTSWASPIRSAGKTSATCARSSS